MRLAELKKTWIDVAAQAVCIAASLAGLVVAAWVVISDMADGDGIDAMFLLVVALSFAVFFGTIPLQAIRRGEWKVFARRAGKAEVSRDRSASA